MNIVLDHSDARPLPVQICASIRSLVVEGLLEPGEKLPSTRILAEQLGVSRGTIVTAFDQLIAEGYLVARHGSGTHINPALTPKPLHPHNHPLPAPPEQPLNELTPGLPDTRGLVTPEWRAAWRDAAANPTDLFSPLGLEALRREISHHLRHMRGFSIDPSRIVVTAGARDGMELFLKTQPSNLTVGVESPGYPSLRQIPTALGHTLVDIPTDGDGLTLPTTHVDAVIATPSHQYPYGTSMSATRRTELVAWARDNERWLIEDDFDSELRYLGQPLPALASLDPEHTILLGTFSSVISPSIGCGYVVFPASLMPRVEQIRDIFRCPVSSITQQALATYLASGALRRHTGRVRRSYRRRRDLVTNSFQGIPDVTLLPINGGLHAVLLCRDPESLRARARRRGVGLTLLADYWGGAHADEGIVLGFGHLSDSELEEALGIIAEELKNTP
ncbi:PLP-dependent aminotransferase family protein [Corynebacterium sp. 321]|uniref:MocR-like pyridoxine biosynthesis transcription factor PdxR n=1 Tax=Corynebacterium sp. 321 TaxID=2651047 RepID=UPI00130186FD|nr:PLP-dependent aminotransferase family protein [Corynebacterium sp. 321]KAB1551225.1 PLP-dependent aminotransferase family protein [Corynebacterium sp. 321]